LPLTGVPSKRLFIKQMLKTRVPSRGQGLAQPERKL
jgi:hypothetical protein